MEAHYLDCNIDGQPLSAACTVGDPAGRSARFVPYVQRGRGGVRAPVLSVLRDPGKATRKTDVPRKLNPDVVARGAVILTDVLSLVTDLKVLILQGDEAKWAWAMVQAFRPRYGLATVQLGDVVSPARTRGRTQGNRRREKAQQFDACRRVADIVHER